MRILRAKDVVEIGNNYGKIKTNKLIHIESDLIDISNNYYENISSLEERNLTSLLQF